MERISELEFQSMNEANSVMGQSPVKSSQKAPVGRSRRARKVDIK
jgi:hypothetical protein